MWVNINSSIFSNISYARDVKQLINFAFEGSLDIEKIKIKLFSEYDEIVDSAVFNELDLVDQELLEEIFKEFYYADNCNINYSVSEENKNNEKSIFTLEEAKEFFKESFAIVLENGKNDSHFIKSILYHFDKNIEFYNHAIEKRWIVFDHAGGCSSVINLIKGKLSPFETLASKYGANTSKYVRGIVILDSDKKHPLSDEKENTKINRKYLEEQNIWLHVLEKRAMENYLPDEVLTSLKSLKSKSRRQADINCIKWINVYENLNNSQKDFLKYEGFDVREFLEHEIDQLFSNVHQTQREILSHGISYNNFSLPADEINFKNSFPLLFNDNLVNKKTLLNRSGTNELTQLLSKIKELL